MIIRFYLALILFLILQDDSLQNQTESSLSKFLVAVFVLSLVANFVNFEIPKRRK